LGVQDINFSIAPRVVDELAPVFPKSLFVNVR